MGKQGVALDIVIRNEDDAWKWLEKAANDDPDLNQPVNLKFDGWPSLDLRFKGHDFDSSVPTRIMPPLLDAQREIHRLFCQLRYGEQNLRKLTFDDKARLELNVKVGQGSSDFKTNLERVLTEAAQSAVSKMESKHIVVCILGIALSWTSSVAWKDWLSAQEKKTEVESRVQMSALEKEKLTILAKAKENPTVKSLSGGIDDFRNDSLHKLKPQDEFKLPGLNVEVDGSYAADITTKPREQSVEVRIDGEFVIQSVVSGETNGYKVKVKRVLDGNVFTLSIPDGTLDRDQISILQRNEWAKRPLIMEINAKKLRGEITSATLVSANEIKLRNDKPEES